MALCAQVPNLAWEFDAVNLRFYAAGHLSGWVWGGFSACRGTDVCHMVTVHRYLHALTEGRADATTRAATRTLETLLEQGNAPDIADPNRVCAAGFPVHLLGDPLAHRRLRDPGRMHAPGMGHFRDNHDPDYVLYDDDRVNSYMVYARTLDRAFRSATAEMRWAELAGILKRLRGDAVIDNHYSEKLVRDALLGGLGAGVLEVSAPYKPTINEQTKGSSAGRARTCWESTRRRR